MGLLGKFGRSEMGAKERAHWTSVSDAVRGWDTAAGMPQQEMPASTLSMDWRLIWHTQQERPPVTVWRPVFPLSIT